MDLGFKGLDRLYIDGDWAVPQSGDFEAVLNPATEEVIGQAPVGNQKDTDAAIGAARQAFDTGPWARMSVNDRVVILQKFHGVLQQKAKAIQHLLVVEAGSTQMLAQTIQFSTPMEHLQYAIHEAPRVAMEALTPELTPDLANPNGGMILGAGVVVREPIGVVAAITPYNFPFFMNVAKVGPALVMGNSIVLKPSPFTPFSALLLAEAAEEAGIPRGVLNIVTGGSEVGALMSNDSRVDMVTFTGSDIVGSAIMGQAANSLKRVLLELGGKSAMIVTADANLQAAAASGLGGFIIHSGQGCACLTRHIVHNSVRPAYVEMLKAMTGYVQIGDPANPATSMGPLIRETQRAKVEHYVEQAIADGATLVAGGRRPEGLGKGYFFEPTIFDNVDNGSALAREEIFGPVCAVMGYDTDEEAIALANDSHFGLAGAIYSGDAAKAYEMALQVRAGMMTINGGNGKMSSHAPYGGYKRSGIGREYGSGWLREYCEEKAISFRAG